MIRTRLEVLREFVRDEIRNNQKDRGRSAEGGWERAHLTGRLQALSEILEMIDYQIRAEDTGAAGGS